MNLKSAEKLSLEQALRQVVRDSQLEMYYQPYVDINSGKITGVEALVRWNHPSLGTIYPGEFIPVAEEIGIISSIGNWIIKAACQQGKNWHKHGIPLLVSVNISAKQFADERFVENTMKILKETGYNPRCLELEITESVAMENMSRTTAKLAELKNKGILISIDDFGTGYSSLNYLKKFPVHKLKIDRSFLIHAMQNPQDQAIVRAIISMGSSLGLKVCAEGVEDKEQLQMLASTACQLAQGYFISKPLATLELMEWLKSHKRENSNDYYFPIR